MKPLVTPATEYEDITIALMTESGVGLVVNVQGTGGSTVLTLSTGHFPIPGAPAPVGTLKVDVPVPFAGELVYLSHLTE